MGGKQNLRVQLRKLGASQREVIMDYKSFSWHVAIISAPEEDNASFERSHKPCPRLGGLRAWHNNDPT